MSCCRLNLPSQVLLHWCLTLKVLVPRRRGGGGGEGKWWKKKGLEKIVTLIWANADTKLFISTVSRRGQPTGRSILAEVLRRMIYTVAFSPLHDSSDVHITHMHIHTFLQRALALLACLVYPSLPTDVVCVCVCVLLKWANVCVPFPGPLPADLVCDWAEPPYPPLLYSPWAWDRSSKAEGGGWGVKKKRGGGTDREREEAGGVRKKGDRWDEERDEERREGSRGERQ